MDAETINEILESLKKSLGVTEEADITILEEILNDAISEIKEARKYPSDMDASEIEEDLLNYKSNIKKLTKYDYNQVGAELQTSHNENGVSRQYSDRRRCFDGVVPFCVMF
jgi:hypothetical protein